MKIGFLISGIGVFGSVREVVENCNVLTDLGHECFIFNPEGEIVVWLPCKARAVFESKMYKYELDVLILCTTPTNHYLQLFEKATAKLKMFCFMGFDPTINIFENNPNLTHIVNNYHLIADGMWQIDWLEKNTRSEKIIDCQLGGVNTSMFAPLQNTSKSIGWSGDHRKRKGGSTLIKYFDLMGLKPKTYFGKGIRQEQMKDWFSGIWVFIDNHYSGGWCNPVMEAMACGVPVICSDIECNKAFAIEGETALKFPFNDFETLGKQLKRLNNDMGLRNTLIANGLEMAKKYSYENIARQFEQKLIELI